MCPHCSKWSIKPGTDFIGEHHATCPEVAARAGLHRRVRSIVGKDEDRRCEVASPETLWLSGVFTAQELGNLAKAIESKDEQEE